MHDDDGPNVIGRLRDLSRRDRLRSAFDLTAASLMISTCYDDAEREHGAEAILREWAKDRKLVVEDLPVPRGGPDWDALAVVRIRTDLSSRVEVYYRRERAP